jgi:hypothetical protein
VKKETIMTTNRAFPVLRLATVSALAALLALPAFAGDALFICNSGEPFLWPAGGVNIPFNPDQGNLKSTLPIIDNTTGVTLVQQSFDNWTDLTTSSVSYLNAGPLPVNVDVTNFGPWLNPVAPDGFSAIVFDEDGQIFDLLFGPGSGILGFASPEWADLVTCEVTEGVSFLNGPAFTDLTAAEDVMTHEFGHYTNLGHVELNGQLVSFGEGGDDSGPSPDNTTFGVPTFVGTEVIETMYPFYFGPLVGTLTPHADDVAIISALYPEAGFFANTGSISGTVYAPDGETRLSGVNVIARNVANPFVDSVSTFSGAFTDDTAQADPNVGIFTLNGLTPGAEYKLFVDEVTALAGRFSNPILQPLPGPEEFHNGANEAGSNPPDDPTDMVSLFPSAGIPLTDVDVIFNQPAPGDALAVGDDGFVQLFLPFTFCITGQPFDSVFVNANGSLTFGAGDADFTESEAEFLAGPPRIAGLWDDLNASAGGVVTFDQTSSTFTVSYTDVPEWFNTGANTFEIKLRDNHRDCVKRSHRHHAESAPEDSTKFLFPDVTITYGDVGITDGLAGVSGGAAVTSGFETEVDLTGIPFFIPITLLFDAAVFELFDLDNDLAGTTQRFWDVGRAFRDRYENNDSLSWAKTVSLPFDTIDTKRDYTEISPAGDDVDYFKVRNLKVGQTLIAETVTGQIDSVLGVFNRSTGELVAVDDDGGNGFLSRVVYEIPANGDYVVAVSTFPDFDFTGDGNDDPVFGQGRYVLDVQAIDGQLLTLGDDNSVEVSFGFTFPFQGGSYTSAFVNSNGNVTFGAGDSDFSESLPELLGNAPRIAPLWDDLSPNNAGLVVFNEGDDCVEISFLDVPEFTTTGANTFSVVFDADGNVNLDYGPISAVDGLAGVTEGGGAADNGGSDLTADGPFSVTGTTYEIFGVGNPNDLSDASVVFGDDISCGDEGGRGHGHGHHWGDDDDDD